MTCLAAKYRIFSRFRVSMWTGIILIMLYLYRSEGKEAEYWILWSIMPNNLRCLINFEIVRLCSECIYGIHFVYASLIKDLKPGSVNPRFLTLFWCGFDPSVFVCPQNELGFCSAHECDEPAGCRPVLCAGPTGRSVASTRLTCDRQHVCVSVWVGSDRFCSPPAAFSYPVPPIEENGPSDGRLLKPWDSRKVCLCVCDQMSSQRQ